MVLIIKSRSHFLYLCLFTFSERQRKVSKMWFKSGQACDLGVLCTLSKIQSISIWVNANEGREHGNSNSEGWGEGSHSRSSKLWGKVRTVGSKNCWYLCPHRIWGSKVGKRRKKEMSPLEPWETILLWTFIYSSLQTEISYLCLGGMRSLPWVNETGLKWQVSVLGRSFESSSCLFP